MKTATIKNLSMLFGVFLLSACVPEQVTEFQKLLDVAVGDGASITLDEDTSAPITYIIPLSDDAVDPDDPDVAVLSNAVTVTECGEPDASL